MDRNDQTFNLDQNWNVNDIQHGWDVFDANGDKVGDVKDVNPTYLTVSKGFFFPTERYIPVQDIQGTRHDRVYLNVTKDELQQEGWDQVPTTERSRRTTVRDLNEQPTMTTTERVANQPDQRQIDLTEERLVPREERVKAGEVNLHTDVVSKEETLEVPVTREEVIVERQPVQGRPATGEPIGQEQDISVPVYEERVDLEKEPVVYEQVNVETRPVTETREVTGQVKKEVLDVNPEGDVNVVKRGKGTPPTADEVRETRGTDVPPSS